MPVSTPTLELSNVFVLTRRWPGIGSTPADVRSVLFVSLQCSNTEWSADCSECSIQFSAIGYFLWYFVALTRVRWQEILHLPLWTRITDSRFNCLHSHRPQRQRYLYPWIPSHCDERGVHWLVKIPVLLPLRRPSNSATNDLKILFVVRTEWVWTLRAIPVHPDSRL